MKAQFVTEREDGSRAVSIYFDRDDDKEFGPSRSVVKPEFLTESLISTIIKKATKTGQLPIREGAYYGDFTGSADFIGRQNAVISMHRYFDSLPSDVRDYFANDPANYLDFVSDPKNEEKALELGLFKKPKVAPAPAAPVEPVKPVEPVPAKPVEPVVKPAS